MDLGLRSEAIYSGGWVSLSDAQPPHVYQNTVRCLIHLCIRLPIGCTVLLTPQGFEQPDYLFQLGLGFDTNQIIITGTLFEEPICPCWVSEAF